MEGHFLQYYRDTKMFLYIGKNLDRTSDQLWLRLQSIYHCGEGGAIPSATQAAEEEDDDDDDEEEEEDLLQAKAFRRSGIQRRSK